MPKPTDSATANKTDFSAFNASSNALIVLNEENKVSFDNRMARRWLGITENEPLSFSDVSFSGQDIQLSDREHRLVKIEQLLQTPQLFPIIAIHRNNETRWLNFKFTFVNPQQRILEFTDITTLVCELNDLRALVDNAISSDTLTRLYNRRYAMERIEQMHHHAKRYQSPFTIALIDIDHFKRVNDTFGHQFGDQVLQRLAKVIKNSFRETDLCSRYGGEEFLILMPETQTAEAILSLDRLRQQISELKWDQMQRPVTISSGVISWQKNKSIEQLLFLADQRLATAKKAGRNQVCGDLL